MSSKEMHKLDARGRPVNRQLLWTALVSVAADCYRHMKKEEEKEEEKSTKKADMRSLQKQPELPLETLKKLPGKTLRELLSTPTSDDYSQKIEFTCRFYPDGRCKETFKRAFDSREDQVQQLVENHLKMHISHEEKRGQLFTTSSAQFRAKKVKDSSKKGKQPKASLKRTSKDTCPEEEPPVKKMNKSLTVSRQENENETQELEVTEEEISVTITHSYAALPGTKPRQEDPVSPTTSESGSLASEISMEADEDSQSVLGGHPYAAQEEAVSDGTSKKCEAEGERVAYPTLPRKRVTEPKSPEEVSRAKQFLDEIQKNKKDPNFKRQCMICPERQLFTEVGSLVSHVKSVHAGIRAFHCTEPGCEASFTRKNSLQYHVDNHRGKFKFNCGYCPKKFNHKGHFQDHLRGHTGERPFVCSHCPNSFPTSTTYKRHLKVCHAILLNKAGETKISDEEFAKVRTRAYKKSESLPQAQEQASPSTSGSSSPKLLIAEPES